MAGASDKARFHLEQTVPELREWERREVFSKNEIAAIAAKRSDFEHILNARGSKPSDYARYAEYEMNLDSLRRRRVKRKGIKATTHTGQRRIFSILDRATIKFHGDIGLWMQYIDYARKQKANKKLNRILTNALRMHSTSPQLWIYAARYAIDVQADIASARSYMQRALRFCPESTLLYLEYARIEMTYIAKYNARRSILGLENSPSLELPDSADHQDDLNADIIALPVITEQEMQTGETSIEHGDESSTDKLSLTPVMSGAIPIAIFDAAMKKFPRDQTIGELFFNMFSEFQQIHCLEQILNHVVNELLGASPHSSAALACKCKLPLQGIASDSQTFPSALRLALKEVKICSQAAEDKPGFAEKVHAWLSEYVNTHDLVSELQTVIYSALRQLRSEVGSDFVQTAT